MTATLSQHALHDFRLHFSDRSVAGASLFPFFDDDGVTRALMFTSDKDDRIVLIRYEESLITGAHHGPRGEAIALEHADLTDSTEADAEAIAHLWHFDPWWELGATRFAGHEAVPPLKSTNIPGYDQEITHVAFDPTLARVVEIGHGEGVSRTTRGFEPRLLARASDHRGSNR